jgi:hypothetical protein
MEAQWGYNGKKEHQAFLLGIAQCLAGFQTEFLHELFLETAG